MLSTERTGDLENLYFRIWKNSRRVPYKHWQAGGGGAVHPTQVSCVSEMVTLSMHRSSCAALADPPPFLSCLSSSKLVIPILGTTPHLSKIQTTSYMLTALGLTQPLSLFGSLKLSSPSPRSTLHSCALPEVQPIFRNQRDIKNLGLQSQPCQWAIKIDGGQWV